MSEERLIYSTGVCGPLGLTTRSALAAANAGIRAFSEIEEVTDPVGEPARGCTLDMLVDRNPVNRAMWFAKTAVCESLGVVEDNVSDSIPVFLATSSAAAATMELESLARDVQAALPAHVRLQWSEKGMFTGGRAAGATALSAALNALNVSPLVLIGGADCLVAGEPLHNLSNSNRLLGQSNCDGRLPGEGAAFLLLGRAGALRGVKPRSIVHATAGASDPRPFDDEQPALGEGLTQVIASLRSSWPGRVDEVIAAQSTERFWGTELSIAYLRNVEFMPEPMRDKHLANVFGDCGACAFPLGLVWATEDCASKQADLSSVLVVSSSDSGSIGGAVICAVPD